VPQQPQKLNIYQMVTDRIIASIEKGVIPWERPWKSPKYKGGLFPRNLQTGKPYRGVNVMLLWTAQFSSPYYSTLFHELVHSTGHPSRLDRVFGKLFGDKLYSKEELIAETGAAFLCAITEMATERTEEYEFVH
jgi:antirestriction protein ArdC